MPSTPTSTDTPAQGNSFGQMRETFISLGISLVMAFIAKAYVIEAYVIPTGSMGPTLLGRHMRYDGPQTGYDWAVETWHKRVINGQAFPLPTQGGTFGGSSFALPHVADPMTVGASAVGAFGMTDAAREGGPLPESKKVRAGDRILVQKYLYDFFEPERYDVVVFKNPTGADQNYIKRLIALPNEHVWLLDGDVFTAPVPESPQAGYDPAADAAWSIQRKPFSQQRRLWQQLFSSEFSPVRPTDRATGRRWFERPWLATTEGWAFGDDGVYEYTGTEPTALEWDSENWPVDDWTFFNDEPRTRQFKQTFPVGDVRVRAAVIGAARFIIEAHGETFEARFTENETSIRSRPIDGGDWNTLATADGVGNTTRARNYEFWFADQAVSLVVDGKPIIKQVPIEWDASERLVRSTGSTLESIQRGSVTALLRPNTYERSKPSVRIEVDGPTKLYRVGLDRDLYYRSVIRGSQPAYGGTPATIATLGDDHFWLIGDNSTNSLDARAWPTEPRGKQIDPFVADQIDDTVGVIHRDMLLGKAFFVYWPAVYSASDSFFVPVPDFGRMRFID